MDSHPAQAHCCRMELGQERRAAELPLVSVVDDDESTRDVLCEILQDEGYSVLSVASGELRAGVSQRATVLADALEAAIGAMYLDGGLPAARVFIRRLWAPRMEQQTKPPKDPKTALQEYALARGWGLPGYTLLHQAGPPHDPVFRVGVALPGCEAQGEGSSKQAAERAAAAALMARLEGGTA